MIKTGFYDKCDCKQTTLGFLHSQFFLPAHQYALKSEIHLLDLWRSATAG